VKLVRQLGDWALDVNRRAFPAVVPREAERGDPAGEGPANAQAPQDILDLGLQPKGIPCSGVVAREHERGTEPVGVPGHPAIQEMGAFEHPPLSRGVEKTLALQ
jgi:hypothetical protein